MATKATQPIEWGKLVAQYKTIYVDPPYNYDSTGTQAKWRAQLAYPPMKFAELCAVPVRDLRHPDGCHLYLWTPNRRIPQALEIMHQWGFEYMTAITWLKEAPKAGSYFGSMSEQCLFGVAAFHVGNAQKPKLPYKEIDGVLQRGATAFYSPREPGLRKPDKMRSMIEHVSYEPRLEIWPKEIFQGWDTWDGKNLGDIRPLAAPKAAKKTAGVHRKVAFTE